MKTTGVFTTHSFEIPFLKYGQAIKLIPVSDVHWNSPACDREKFLKFCAEYRDVPDCYYLLGGDYVDTLSTSERKKFKDSDYHDSSIKRIERTVKEDTEEFIRAVSFMKGKTIGVVGGNHYFTFSSGITTDNIIADALETRFLGVNSLIRLVLRYDKTHAHKIDICIHHGQTGGRTVGASMNKLQQMANSFDADIILQGHDHNRAVDYINRLGLTDHGKHGNFGLINRRILLARTGSFLKGYLENEPSYVVDAALPPTDLGVIIINLIPTRENKRENGVRIDNRWVDIHASV